MISINSFQLYLENKNLFVCTLEEITKTVLEIETKVLQMVKRPQE